MVFPSLMTPYMYSLALAPGAQRSSMAKILQKTKLYNNEKKKKIIEWYMVQP